MSVNNKVCCSTEEISDADKAGGLKPVAMIMAGYNKIDSETKIRKNKEIREYYDGDEIYMGQNKFLHTLAGKPVIQYVIDAVYNARKNGERLYDKIYCYNDTESFLKAIDVSQYPNLHLKEMTESVGGHWKDFYFKYIDYGQRVDVFFGDTPRIKSEDVEYLHDEYEKIIGREKDHRGAVIRMIFTTVVFEDMTDNWLEHRIRYIKRGHNKGKLKSFVYLTDGKVRVGNSGAIIKHKSLDDMMRTRAVNFLYNLRKALTPSSFSKILYHLWKTKHFDMIKQVKNKCIDKDEMIDAVIEVAEKLYKIDLSEFGVDNLNIRKNASRWENDIDGPKDYEAFQKKFSELGL